MQIDRATVEQQGCAALVNLADNAGDARFGNHPSGRRGIFKDDIHPFNADTQPSMQRSAAFLHLDCHRIATGIAQADLARRITFPTPKEATLMQTHLATFR